MEYPDKNAVTAPAGGLVHLHLIASLDPKGGGPQEGLKQLAAAGMRAGQRVEIASLDSVSAPWLEGYSCPAHALGSGRLGRYSYSAALLPWLLAQAPRIGVVVVHGLWQYHSLAAWRFWRRTGIPYVIYTHGMLDPWFKTTFPLKHLKKSLYWPWAERRVLRDASSVLFTCEDERVLARESFSNYAVNERVVGLGIPAPTGNPEAQRAAFLAQFPGLHGKRLLLFLGRIHPKKGCDLLVEAFAGVAARDPALHLIIAGPDQFNTKRMLAERARALGIEQRIVWTGMLSGDLKWGAFHAAHAFVLPSHQENFGIAVVEALACGLPVLISRKVNIWREIAGEAAGFTAEDSIAGTQCLLNSWLAASEAELARMSSSARVCFDRNFRIEAAATRLSAAIASA